MKICGGCEHFKDGRCYLNPPVMMQPMPVQYVSGDSAPYNHHFPYQHGVAYTQGSFAPTPVRPTVGKDEKACGHWADAVYGGP